MEIEFLESIDGLQPQSFLDLDFLLLFFSLHIITELNRVVQKLELFFSSCIWPRNSLNFFMADFMEL